MSLRSLSASLLVYCVFVHAFAFASVGTGNVVGSSSQSDSDATTTSSSITIYSTHTWILEPILEQTAVAYRLQAPSASVVSIPAETAVVKSAVFANSVDIGFISGSLSAADKTAHPTIAQYPMLLGAMVPVFHLPGIKSLTLSRSALARIFRANISYWDDPAIAITNPDVTLPHQPITCVVQAESTGRTQVFTAALSKFDSVFAKQVGSSGLVTWPFTGTDKDRLLPVLGQASVASTVLSTPYTIGYAVATLASQLNNDVASLINRAGVTVHASFESLMYAAMETGLTVDSTGTLQPSSDLSDCGGANGWPIVFYSYLLVDVSATKSGCDAKAAVVSFLLWLLNSNSNSQIAPVWQSLTLSVIPDSFVNSLQLTQRLLTELKCNNASLTDVTGSQTVVFAATASSQQAVQFLQPLLGHYDSTSSSDFQTRALSLTKASSPGSGTATLQSELFTLLTNMQQGSVEVGVIVPELLKISMSSNTISSGDFFNQLVRQWQLAISNVSSTVLMNSPVPFRLVPGWMMPLTLMYNLPSAVNTLLASLSASDPLRSLVPLKISMSAVRGLYNGTVVSWLDSAITATNPLLQQAFEKAGASSALRIVACCSDVGSTTSLTDSLLYALGLPVSNSDSSRWSASQFALASTESQLRSMMDLTPGSIGYSPAVQGNGSLVSSTFTVISDSGIATVADASSSKACATSRTTLLSPIERFPKWQDGLESVMPDRSAFGCWPFQVAFGFIVPSTFNSLSANYQCSRASATLQTIDWLLSGDSLDVASALTLSPVSRFSDSISVSTVLTDSLQSLTCDGSNILISLPLYWSLSAPIRTSAIILVAIGLCTVVCMMILLIANRRHSLIRGTSPPMQVCTLIGLGVLLMSTLFAVPSGEPTSASCMTFVWLANFGFTLSFVPLVLKAWRLHTIFGARRLQVVKVSNHRLLVAMMLCLCEDVAMVAVWQSVAPTSVAFTSQLTGNTEHRYAGCAVGSTGLPFLVTQMVLKALLLFVAVWLCVTTRNVSQLFNEAKAVALTIYNATLVLILTVPLLTMFGIEGDGKGVLYLFALVWIPVVSSILLFAPRFWQIWMAPSTATEGAIANGAANLNSKISNTDDGNKRASLRSVVKLRVYGSNESPVNFDGSIPRRMTTMAPSNDLQGRDRGFNAADALATPSSDAFRNPVTMGASDVRVTLGAYGTTPSQQQQLSSSSDSNGDFAFPSMHGMPPSALHGYSRALKRELITIQQLIDASQPRQRFRAVPTSPSAAATASANAARSAVRVSWAAASGSNVTRLSSHPSSDEQREQLVLEQPDRASPLPQQSTPQSHLESPSADSIKRITIASPSSPSLPALVIPHTPRLTAVNSNNSPNTKSDDDLVAHQDDLIDQV